MLASALVALPGYAIPQQKQIPIPKPAPARETAEQPWYYDARWWGIGASGALSLLSLLLQWRYRVLDRQSKEASESFDGDIRDPIKETYKDLRTLANLAAVASETDDAAARADAIKKLRYDSACTTLSLFSMVLKEADRRLSLRAEFLEINAELEDALYLALGSMTKCDDAIERRALQKKISDAVSHAIVACDAKLGLQRKAFLRNWK
ncbi:hypothetical protein ACNJYD_04355 [Bradyrhizobium sp. DASA03005]|uniref:hypothetical protein n=1 Tax=Bradyrhizobium sp. SPXBL-02 TaxID=3395912 RepID=UPI003F6EACEA